MPNEPAYNNCIMEKNKINLKRGCNPTIREVKKAQKNSVEFDSKKRDLGVK